MQRVFGGLAAAAVVVTASVAVGGQQIKQETGVRFPAQAALEWTNQLTIGDIDNDGDLDIIFANGGNFSSAGSPQPVRVYLNDGAGIFTDNSAAAVGLSGLHRGVELGDIDDDGDLDMILVQDFNRTPNLMINDGTGVFANETVARLGVLALSSSRAQFADIDNDGDLDLFITSGTSSRFTCGQYRLFTNDGDGFFTDVTNAQFPIGPVCNNMDCIFGDIDADFDLDIRTASTGTNNSRLYGNDGTGTYTQLAVPADNSAYSYDFGDIDGDGDLDLLGANAGVSNTEKLMANDGAGVYTDVSGQLLSNPNIDDNDSKFFDYDGDGDMDLIVGALGGASERIYRNTGGGVYSLTTGVITLQTDSTLDIMVADLNGDNRYDVVTAQGESNPPYDNRIYINYGPPDILPPIIHAVEQQADTEDAKGPYVIRASITDHMTSDRNFFDQGIFLNYTTGLGPVQVVEMKYSGGQIYRGEIPGQPGGSNVSYWVTANDWASNTATSETLAFTVLGGSFCAADLTGPTPGEPDGNVDSLDFLLLIGQWGTPCVGSCEADITGPTPGVPDGNVDSLDYLLMIAQWGSPGNCP